VSAKKTEKGVYMTTLPRIGALLAGLSFASGLTQPEEHPLVHGPLTDSASDLAAKCHDYVTAPATQPEEPLPVCSLDPKDSNYRVIPNANGDVVRTSLDESDCQDLASRMNPQDHTTFDAFRTLGETQGVSPDNKIWVPAPGLAQNNPRYVYIHNVKPEELPQSVMWGNHYPGLFITLKLTIDKVHECTVMFFHDKTPRADRLLTSFDRYSECQQRLAALDTSQFYREGGTDPDFLPQFASSLRALLQGEELRTAGGQMVTLADPTQKAEKPAAQIAVDRDSLAVVLQEPQSQPNEAIAKNGEANSPVAAVQQPLATTVKT
jgi:hypothetical protein